MKSYYCFFVLFFFFFQAEDGIRDWSVTGVQTCALPISDGLGGSLLFQERTESAGEADAARRRRARIPAARAAGTHALRRRGAAAEARRRSEERRVGKESRARGWTGDHNARKKHKGDRRR